MHEKWLKSKSKMNTKGCTKQITVSGNLPQCTTYDNNTQCPSTHVTSDNLHSNTNLGVTNGSGTSTGDNECIKVPVNVHANLDASSKASGSTSSPNKCKITRPRTLCVKSPLQDERSETRHPVLHLRRVDDTYKENTTGTNELSKENLKTVHGLKQEQTHLLKKIQQLTEEKDYDKSEVNKFEEAKRRGREITKKYELKKALKKQQSCTSNADDQGEVLKNEKETYDKKGMETCDQISVDSSGKDSKKVDHKSHTQDNKDGKKKT